MTDAAAARNSQTKVLETIVEAGKKAFDPSAETASREIGLREYNDLTERTETWLLLPTLNALIKPKVLPPWLAQPLMQTLTRLPLRPDGVRATMEFVFSVHPSNSGQTADPSNQGKQGAAITHEAVAVATKLLSSVPASMTADVWFQGISSQLFALIDGQAGPEIARTAAQIVGFGILGKKQFGAPGAPGWKRFVEPILQDINPSMIQTSDNESSSAAGGDQVEIVNLGVEQILVAAQALERSLRRLQTLIMSNPSPGLCRRVLKPVLMPLWTLVSWPSPSVETERRFCETARGLLQTYMRLFGTFDSILPFIKNLLHNGSVDQGETAWKFRSVANGGINAVKQQKSAQNAQTLNFGEVGSKSATLVDVVVSACSAEEISSIFLHLLRGWIQASTTQANQMIKTSIENDDPESAIQSLIEVNILQSMMEKAPDKLVSHFDQLLELLSQVFKADGQSPLGDDVVIVALSLLNLVITAPTFQKSDINPDELKIVEESLDRIGHQDRQDVSTTARNLAMLLKYRDDVEQPTEKSAAPSTRQIEDRRIYNLAMNYITGDADSPPPVVSEGLNMLSGLILAESPILDITAVMVLLSNLLKEKEDYINLRVIKVFTQLANKHPKSTIRELLDNYLDAQEKSTTDVRLRFGEALLQVIERLGDTFTEEVAQNAGETLLSIAGRRGYRPKSMARQAKEEKLREMKKNKGKKANAEDDEDELTENEDETAEDKANNEVLAQIVQGWESKRGSEDIRMRTSALSIFGNSLEINIVGMGPTLVSAGVDLCVSILAMEPELEKGILRRAAILVILSFVKALDKARDSGRALGFGLTDTSREDIQRTLTYVAGTDNDGLVQQHAQDVVESLESWGMISLLPRQSETGTAGMTRLAGLVVNPGVTLPGAAQQGLRPRIEEVE